MTSDQPKTTASTTTTTTAKTVESEGRTEQQPVAAYPPAEAVSSSLAAAAKEEDHHHHDEHHHGDEGHGHHHHHHGASPSAASFEPLPEDNVGLRATSEGQERELNDLTMRSNRLAWRVWNEAILQSTDGGVEANRILSPLALTTALGISFLGAGGSTAEAIDKALGLDSLTYRNPHLHRKTIDQQLTVRFIRTHLLFCIFFLQCIKWPMMSPLSAQNPISTFLALSRTSSTWRRRLPRQGPAVVRQQTASKYATFSELDSILCTAHPSPETRPNCRVSPLLPPLVLPWIRRCGKIFNRRHLLSSPLPLST